MAFSWIQRYYLICNLKSFLVTPPWLSLTTAVIVPEYFVFGFPEITQVIKLLPKNFLVLQAPNSRSFGKLYTSIFILSPSRSVAESFATYFFPTFPFGKLRVVITGT